ARGQPLLDREVSQDLDARPSLREVGCAAGVVRDRDEDRDGAVDERVERLEVVRVHERVDEREPFVVGEGEAGDLVAESVRVPFRVPRGEAPEAGRELVHRRTLPNYRPVGPVAAGGSAIDARRLVSALSGTWMSPRVGRSRSKVTRSSIVTRAAASTTGVTPRPRSER